MEALQTVLQVIMSIKDQNLTFDLDLDQGKKVFGLDRLAAAL